jgi:hypothetical protein
MTAPGRAMTDLANSVLNWLSANSVVLGVPAQNWMLVFGVGLLIYIAAVVIADRRQSRAR